MSKSSGTKNALLMVIAVVLLGILAVMLYQMNEKTPAEKAADSVEKAAEDIGNAIRGE